MFCCTSLRTQLQRPWQSAGTGARVVPNRFRWASSQQRSINESPAVTRPRSGAPISRIGVGAGSSLISRRRPSTGGAPQAPSRHQGETHARPNGLPESSKGPQPIVRWDGTAAEWTPRGHGHAINNGAVRNNSSRPSSTGPGVNLAEKQQSARRVVSGEATSTAPLLQHSPLSSPSFFASSIATETTATDDGDATTGGGPQQQRKRNENAYWRQTTVESKSTTARQKNLVVTAANKLAVDGNNGLRAPPGNNAPGSESTGSRPAAGRRRPYSASGSLIQGSSPHPNSSSGSASTRPQTVGAHSSVSRAPFSPVSSEGFRDAAAGAGGDALAAGDQLLVLRGTESGGDFSTSFGEEGRGPGSSSVGGRVSVSVVLPVLEKENDARDER